MDPVILRIGAWIGSEQPVLSTRIQQIHKSAHDTAAAAIKRAKKWRLLPVFTLLALIASIALFAPLALLDSVGTERRLSDFVAAGRSRGSKSDVCKRQRSSLFGSVKTRDYKLVQTVAVMASTRKGVDDVGQDSGAERRNEQTVLLTRALICRIPLLALSMASICLGFLKMSDCVDEPWIPVGVAVHGILMMLDVALAAAALLAVASSCAAAVKRAVFALTVCNWLGFVAWNVITAAHVFSFFHIRVILINDVSFCDHIVFFYACVLSFGFAIVLCLALIVIPLTCCLGLLKISSESRRDCRRVTESGATKC